MEIAVWSYIKRDTEDGDCSEGAVYRDRRRMEIAVRELYKERGGGWRLQ